jgi:ribulose-5-phosphate 4-epimerase/fuculose-1-phosphate aldolase
MAGEASVREELALACRMLVNEGLLDQSGHISARLPDDPNAFLIHPHRLSRYEVTPATLLVLDLDGEVVEGDGKPPSERFIHAAVYRAQPEVGSVCHIHSRMATVFSIAGRPLRAITNYATFLGPEPVPVYPDPRHVDTLAKGEALAAALGERNACLMRAHGAVIVGADVHETFAASVYLEENALPAYMALQIGELAGYSKDELHGLASHNWTPGSRQKTWDYYRARARRAGLA